MVYSFRICRDHDGADTAQGWVVAQSELRARELLGANAYLHRMPNGHLSELPDDTVYVAKGALLPAH